MIETWILVGHDDRGHAILGAWDYKPTDEELSAAKTSRVIKDWGRTYLTQNFTNGWPGYGARKFLIWEKSTPSDPCFLNPIVEILPNGTRVGYSDVTEIRDILKRIEEYSRSHAKK